MSTQRNTQDVADTRKIVYGRYKADRNFQADLNSRRPYLRHFIKTCVPTNRDQSILDLGCGLGYLMHELNETKYTNVLGVDQIPLGSMPSIIQKLKYEQSDITDFLRVSKRSFDVVITFDVVEHLTRSELLELATLVNERLSGTGIWVVHIPNAGGVFSSKTLYSDLSHEQAFTQDSLRQLAACSALKLVRLIEDKPVVHGPFSLARWVIWQVLTFPLRLLRAAETGSLEFSEPLSMNMTAVFEKG